MQVRLAEMIDHDFHAGEAARHVFQHGHLLRQDVEVENCAETLGFAPKRVVFFRIQPGGVGVIDRAEAHALKSVLLHPITKPSGKVGAGRIQEAVRHKQIRIMVQ